MASDEIEHRAGEPVIVTPVATILSSIQTEQSAGFARVEKSLEGKADKSDLHELKSIVGQHGERIGSLENDLTNRTKSESRRGDRRQALWTIILGLGIIAATILAAVIASLMTGH